MATTTICVFLSAVSLLLPTIDSASIARISERDLEESSESQARADRNSFYEDFGDAKVGGYFNKDQSGGFNATRFFDNGNFGGNFDWDNQGKFSGGLNGKYKSENGSFGGKVDVGKDGRLSGGASGAYKFNNGNTQVGGTLDFGKNGKPSGAFSFSHKF